MDTHHFDTLIRTIGRRGLLATALASPIAALSAATAMAQADVCTKKQPGDRCRRNGDCCSGRCRVKKNKKKGRCRCSQLRKPCFENQDCCGDITGVDGSIVCSDHPDFSEIVCCVSFTGPCQATADCCSNLECIDEVCSEPDT